MRWAIALAVSLSAIVLASDQAMAANSRLETSWRRCANSDAETSIAGCTDIIRSAREREVNRARAFFNRANAYRLKSRYELAIADYVEAIRLKPGYAEAFNNRGIAYYGQRRHERAVEDYDQAIRLKPDFAEAFNNRCLAYLKLNQYERAQRDFDQTIRLKQNYGNALINRAMPSETPVR